MIRDLKADDLPAFIQIAVSVANEHYKKRPDRFPDPKESGIGESIRNSFHTHHLSGCLAIKRPDEIMGAMAIRKESGPLASSNAVIDVLFVKAKYRRRGHASRMFKYLSKAAGPDLMVQVWTWNPGAVAFYRRMGLAPFILVMER